MGPPSLSRVLELDIWIFVIQPLVLLFDPSPHTRAHRRVAPLTRIGPWRAKRLRGGV